MTSKDGTGNLWNFKGFQEIKQEIYDWNVKNEDVWICCYPKSGSSWIQEAVWLIVNNLDYEKAKTSLTERSPFLERGALFQQEEIDKQSEILDLPLYIRNPREFIKSLESPVCIKTHLPWWLLPKQIQNSTKTPKIVYITRNPRDLLLSLYHFLIMIGYLSPLVTLEEYADVFLSGKAGFGPFWDHIYEFWMRRNEPNVFFVTYEDMKKDLNDVLRKLASFLERDLSDDQIKNLADHLFFDKMKNNTAVQHSQSINVIRRLHNVDTEAPNTFYRNGTSNQYKASLSQEILKKFETWEKENREAKNINLYFG